MSRSVIGFLCLFIFVYVCARAGVAQTPAPQARFAVEFLGENGFPPTYAMISDTALTSSHSCSTLYQEGSLGRLANANTGAEQPSALRWKVCVEGDTFSFTPIVIFGPLDRANQFAPLTMLRHQTLATQSGRLNDPITFPEMEEVGLEPMTLRVVNAQSDSPYRPLTHSDAPSVLIDYTPVDREGGMITLRNLSGKAVDAFRIGRFQEEGSQEESSIGSYKSDGFSSVIAPGASHRMHIGIPHSGKMVNGMFVEAPKPQYMVLQSVLFADGSYEGDEQTAAKMAAKVFGAQVQLVRIERVVGPILAEKGPDDVAKIGRIRTAIQHLSTQDGPETVAQFRSQYANFPAAMLTHAESNIASAMKEEDESVDSAFQENASSFFQQHHRSSFTLAQWWAMIIRRNPE